MRAHHTLIIDRPVQVHAGRAVLGASLTVLPLFDFYQIFVLNGGWAIAVVDEIRGRGMRW